MDLRHQRELNTEENQFVMKLLLFSPNPEQNIPGILKFQKYSRPGRVYSVILGFPAGDGDHSLKKSIGIAYTHLPTHLVPEDTRSVHRLSK
jgi:hypothetical protein